MRAVSSSVNGPGHGRGPSGARPAKPGSRCRPSAAEGRVDGHYFGLAKGTKLPCRERAAMCVAPAIEAEHRGGSVSPGPPRSTASAGGGRGVDHVVRRLVLREDPVERLHRLVADDPRVVTGWDRVHVAGSEVDAGAVVHLEVPAA